MKKPFIISAYDYYQGSVWIIWANDAEEAKSKVKKYITYGDPSIEVTDILAMKQTEPVCVHTWAE